MNPRLALLGSALLGAVLSFSGCATPQALPASYRQGERSAAVAITRIPPAATFRDSGQGGLIGAIVTAQRGTTFRERLAGVSGDTMREFLRQELERNLEEAFLIDETSPDLRIEVVITNWGFFLPTTALGIKAGQYQMEVMGTVTVHDTSLDPRRSRVAQVPLRAVKPIGAELEADRLEELLLEASRAFAKETMDFILGRPAS